MTDLNNTIFLSRGQFLLIFGMTISKVHFVSVPQGC